jgi:hypothetical protein
VREDRDAMAGAALVMSHRGIAHPDVSLKLPSTLKSLNLQQKPSAAKGWIEFEVKQ